MRCRIRCAFEVDTDSPSTILNGFVFRPIVGSMRIDVRELELSPLAFCGEIPVGDLKLEASEVRVLGKVAVELTAEKHAQEVRVRGKLTAEFEVPCARCLEPVKVPLDAKFDQFYQSHETRRLVGEIELQEKDTEIAFYFGDFIEVSDIIREQILLGLPMKPVCREDCKGLCPRCGKNRNMEVCNCQALFLDPRFAQLLKIKDRMNF
jgi:uncharacterized protein